MDVRTTPRSCEHAGAQGTGLGAYIGASGDGALMITCATHHATLEKTTERSVCHDMVYARELSTILPD
eukprot:868065-Pyramimonas_sp.AAC.1